MVVKLADWSAGLTVAWRVAKTVDLWAGKMVGMSVETTAVVTAALMVV
jgi:hypothetical protein